MDLNNRQTGKHATKPRALGLLGHSETSTTYLLLTWMVKINTLKYWYAYLFIALFCTPPISYNREYEASTRSVECCYVTTESNNSASYLNLLLSIGRDGQLRTSLYDKRDDFNFHITNFPFLSSNIPFSPAYGVFISQLIRYARACSSYEYFIPRAARLLCKLLGQGFVTECLKSSFGKFFGRYGDLIKYYEVPLSQLLHDIPGHDHIHVQ